MKHKHLLSVLAAWGLVLAMVASSISPLTAGADDGGLFVDSGQRLGTSESIAVALGDLDGDGDLDVFVANQYNQANEVWLNDGGVQGGTPGIFTDSGQRLGSSFSYAVALGDVDGDGDLDAFVVNYWGQPDKVWLNDGTGVFRDSGQSLGDSPYGNQVVLEDVDVDGDLDAFVTCNGYPNKVWWNDGAGTFSHGQSLGSSYSHDVALGDVDGDGDLDAFVANVHDYHGEPNRVWLNDGGVQGGTLGTFSDSGQSLGNLPSMGVALGDLDSDGDLDAFVANGGALVPNWVWLNDGGVQGGTPGTFSDSGQRLGGLPSRRVALGDFDSDGDLDAFVVNYDDFGSPNKVWLNDGGVQGGTLGTFSEGQSLGDSYSAGVALGDLDGDGDLDAFVANTNYNPANKVWLNTTAGNQPPDCSNAYPSRDTIWPPNHKFVPIGVLGVTDPDGDAFTIIIEDIYQDEPVETHGDGHFTPDALGVGTSRAELRAERAGTKKVPGNGRVYHIVFAAQDELGATCTAEVQVAVPHDRNKAAVDDGPLYDSAGG